MTTLFLENESVVRLGFFLGILAIMAVWEVLAPRRPLSMSRRVRWLSNLALVLMNTVAVRLIFPAAAVGMSLFVERRQWGLLNTGGLPDGVGVSWVSSS